MSEEQGFDGQGGEGRAQGGGVRKGALAVRARGAIRRGRSRLQRYPRLLRMLVTAWRLGAQLWRKLVDDDCLSRAASLSYTTILAVVPLMAVSFLVFRMSGAFDGVEAEVRHWMLESLLAESVGSVREVLDVFLGRVSSGAVGVTGAVMLVFTSTWLFVSAEGTLNHIWRVAKARSLFARFTTFWAILTLGPLCLGVGFYLSAQLGQTALGRRFESLPWLGRTLQLGLPYLLSVTVLALVYKLVPATRVRWRAALVGGLLAGVLFELSKVGFNFYVTQIYLGSTSTRIYGAFALFPVFLLWIYILWLVVLLGAVVAYTVQHFSLLYDDELRERAPGPDSH
ncbi:MAG: YihY family inner membrane protein, partial [Polyangia bacterium]|nr:YihY family inner membrane protein [Polyangia bacterium]